MPTDTKSQDYNRIASRISTELVQLVLVMGDLVTILAGLSLGYWLKFETFLNSVGTRSENMHFSDYYRLILIGAVILTATFAKLNLYDSNSLLRFRQHGLIILKGSAYWLVAYLSIGLALKFVPEISRMYVLYSGLSGYLKVSAGLQK